MTRLSVNLNKIALLRNSRNLGIPSVTRAANIALDAGAAGITVHPRPDSRHIRLSDVHELAALLADPAVTDRARQACEPTAGRWVSAARHGLADRVLQRAAVTVFELAVATLPRLDAPSWLVADLAVMLERRVRRGLCPADLHTTGPPPAHPTDDAHHAGPAGGTFPAGQADIPEEARA